MPVPFSKRDTPPRDTLRYDVPEMVRSRIFHLMKALNGDQAMQGMLLHAGKCCLWSYGGYNYRTNGVVVASSDPTHEIVEHYFACPADRAIDFMEWLFQSSSYKAGQSGANVVNNVFTEEGIGYEFSPYVAREVERDGRREIEHQYPEATKKTNELLHQTVVMPALQFLSSPTFTTANAEILMAYEHFRHGDHVAAINSCGQALESVFKTIFTAKGWTYDPDKDTLAKLVEIGRSKRLFPEFYVEIFKASGIIRNKFGSHGGGPNPPHGKPDAEHAEHMIHQTSAHILLLIRLSGVH